MAVEIYVHKMTEHMELAKILRWLVNPGEVVVSGQPILEVETDKAVVELEAPASGVLKGIRPGVEEGSEVRVGETIAFIAESSEEVPAPGTARRPAVGAGKRGGWRRDPGKQPWRHDSARDTGRPPGRQGTRRGIETCSGDRTGWVHSGRGCAWICGSTWEERPDPGGDGCSWLCAAGTLDSPRRQREMDGPVTGAAIHREADAGERAGRASVCALR